MARFATVPAGNYAITGRDHDTVRFFRVKVTKTGQYRGARRIMELIAQGGHGYAALGEVWLTDKAFRDQLLSYIERDPQRHLEAFGKLIGHCGVCGRELTDDVSRAAGIGPVCAGKL